MSKRWRTVVYRLKYVPQYEDLDLQINLERTFGRQYDRMLGQVLSVKENLEDDLAGACQLTPTKTWSDQVLPGLPGDPIGTKSGGLFWYQNGRNVFVVEADLRRELYVFMYPVFGLAQVSREAIQAIAQEQGKPCR